MLLALANCLTGEKPCRGESIAIQSLSRPEWRCSVADLRLVIHRGSDGMTGPARNDNRTRRLDEKWRYCSDHGYLMLAGTDPSPIFGSTSERQRLSTIHPEVNHRRTYGQTLVTRIKTYVVVCRLSFAHPLICMFFALRSHSNNYASLARTASCCFQHPP